MNEEDVDLVIRIMCAGHDVDKSGAVNPAVILAEET